MSITFEVNKSIKELSNTIIRLTDIMIEKLDDISIHLVNIYNKLK